MWWNVIILLLRQFPGGHAWEKEDKSRSVEEMISVRKVIKTGRSTHNQEDGCYQEEDAKPERRD